MSEIILNQNLLDLDLLDIRVRKFRKNESRIEKERLYI